MVFPITQGDHKKYLEDTRYKTSLRPFLKIVFEDTSTFTCTFVFLYVLRFITIISYI